MGTARECLEKALSLAPASPQTDLEYALLLESCGDASASLAQLQALAARRSDDPRIAANLARALLFADRASEAESLLEQALTRFPADAALHRQLGLARWQRGATLTEPLERAIAAFPGQLGLRLVAAELLRNAGDPGRALAILQAGLPQAAQSPALLTSIGVLLDDLDRPAEALPYLHAAVAHARDPLPAQRNLVAALLRTGAATEALALCETLLAQTPDDQQLIAHAATALRLTGREEYHALHDYARLVRAYRPAPPAGFADIAAFNAAFAQLLTSLHRHSRRPLAQSLRGGSQTDRNLPLDEPLIAAFFAMIDAPIRDYISRLRAGPPHPTDRRRSEHYRIAGSWSVQLQPAGFHIDHVHPQGWLSSAYYVELPANLGGESRAGWLRFGESGLRIAAARADHFVEPAPGMLVLFPSYLWHGTVPFTEGGRRLTAAFDILPA